MVNIDRVPDDSYWTSIWRKRPWYAAYWSGRPTPDGIFSLAYAKDAPSNECLGNNDRFEALLKVARVEMDENKRKRYIGKYRR